MTSSDRIVEWVQRQIDDGTVSIGGVRVYDDGTVVNHTDLPHRPVFVEDLVGEMALSDTPADLAQLYSVEIRGDGITNPVAVVVGSDGVTTVPCAAVTVEGGEFVEVSFEWHGARFRVEVPATGAS